MRKLALSALIAVMIALGVCVLEVATVPVVHEIASVHVPDYLAILAMAAVVPAVTPALYTINEAAKLLACTRRSIYELLSQGRLDAVKLLGGTRITAASLHALLASVPKAKFDRLPPQARPGEPQRAGEHVRGGAQERRGRQPLW